MIRSILSQSKLRTLISSPICSHTSLNLLKTPKTLSSIHTQVTDESQNHQTTTTDENPEKPVSANAQIKLKIKERRKQQKAERKAIEKEQKKVEIERRKKEWEEKLASLGSEDEKLKLIESRIADRKAKVEKRWEEKAKKLEKLSLAKLHGQCVAIDLEFSHLMKQSELHSLVRQIMFCYAANRKSASPCRLMLTGYKGVMETELKKSPGFDKWVIEKESRTYIEAFNDQKESLVYLTPDAKTVLENLDPKKIYIIGGLVDRICRKGLTMKKAKEQRIQTARLPIGNYLKLSGSHVLAVNQVLELLVKYLETRDWKASFFQVIPQRKRGEVESKMRKLEDEVAERGR